MTLPSQLAALEATGLICLARVEPEFEFRFRHALIQDAAYASTLRVDRQIVHQVVGETLEQLYPQQRDSLIPLLSHHFTQAGAHRLALTYARQASEQAIRQNANEEALEYLTRALRELGHTPEGVDRDRQEVILQTMLGSVYVAIRGEASEEACQAFRRALEICDRRHMHARAFPLRVGLLGYLLARGNAAEARDIAAAAFDFAQQHARPFLESWAPWALGGCLYQCGELSAARKLLERAATAAPPPVLISAIADARVYSLDFAAHVLSLLGYLDQALSSVQQAQRLAQSLGQPIGLAHVAWLSAVICQTRGDLEATDEWAERLERLSEEFGFKYHQAFGMIFHGWVLAHQGDSEQGETLMRAGLKRLQDRQMFMLWPYFLSLLADVCQLNGKPAAGGEVIEAALAFQAGGARFYEAELYRLKGELLLAQGNQDGETWLIRAIEAASGQQAKTLELRTTTSLCRRWAKLHRRSEARQRLTQIYGWFVEGLDTPDLQAARRLLDELSPEATQYSD